MRYHDLSIKSISFKKDIEELTKPKVIAKSDVQWIQYSLNSL